MINNLYIDLNAVLRFSTKKEGEEGGFELDLACSRRLLGEKVRCRAAIFRWLFEKRRRWNWFVPIPSLPYLNY